MEDQNNNLFDNLATTEDLNDFCIQIIKEQMHRNPLEFASSLRNYNVISEELYKEIIMNIKKLKIEEDF